jgi:hypothetical protein
MERLTAKQQKNFTDEVDLIPREHHGFRSLHGSVTANIEMQIQVMDVLDDYNGQRLVEDQALNEEENHDLDIMETERYLELGPQISDHLDEVCGS